MSACNEGLPGFLIVGAIKAATTWTQMRLQLSREVFLPDIEPHYFSREFHRGEQWYRDLFAPAPSTVRLLGEKTADYLANPHAAERLAARLPDAKLVIQLRNPVDRAYSDYKMLFRRGVVRDGPEAYLTSLSSAQPRFLRDGLYGEHLTRWLNLFPRESMLILLYEDIRAQPQSTMDRVASHIGLGHRFENLATIRRENDSSEAFLPLGIRNALAPVKRYVAPLRGNRWFEAARSVIARPVEYPPLSPSLRALLCDFYSKDVDHLSAILGRDMSHWLQRTTGSDPGEGLEQRPGNQFSTTAFTHHP